MIDKAASDIKLLASRLKPLLDVAKALEEIGSLEQAAKEAEKRKAKAYAEAETAAQLREDNEDVLNELLEKIDGAKESYKGLELAAKLRAAEIVKQAETEAQEIELFSKKKRDDSDKAIQVLIDRKEALKADIHSSLQELSQIQSKIKDMRAQIQAFVGAA